MNLIDLIFFPDREETKNKSDICRAANILQIGEFQLLQLAYYDWYGKELPEEKIDPLFYAYTCKEYVPVWGRHYARKILALSQQGILRDLDPSYHRYDVAPPPAPQKHDFLYACLLYAAVLFGSFFLANLFTSESITRFPPYFERATIPDGD